MLAVDRLKKSISSSCGIPRQSTTTTSTQQQLPVNPAVEPRTSSLVRKPSNARSATVDGPATPGRYAQPATATANEIIHIRDDRVVARPEVVAIHVSRSSSTWATAASAADDDDCISGGVSSPLTYESFRGPPTNQQWSPLAAVDVVPDRRDRVGAGDDGERTPTNEVDEMSSQRNDRNLVMTSVTVPASCPTTTSQAPSVTLVSSAKLAATSSSTKQTSADQPPASQAPSVTSPSSPRPRPQIAPKPRLDLRRRRASAGESTSTVGDDSQGVDVASSPSRTGVTSPTSPLSPTPGLAMLASVVAAASSQRMSERCRSPQSPSSIQRSAADTQVDGKISAVSVGNCARPNSASALSRTALNGNGGDLRNASDARTLRTQSRTGMSTSTALGTDKKTQGTGDHATSPSRTTSTDDSPRRSSSTIPPPVPPKHAHSAKVEKRSADIAVPPKVVARSSSSSSSAVAAAVQALSGAGGTSGPGDTGTLPFANENVGTIRQRGPVMSAEQPAASTTSVNDDVIAATGNPFTCTA